MLLQDGTTPLIMACHNGHETVVKLLLDGGSDANKATDVSKSHDNSVNLSVIALNVHIVKNKEVFGEYLMTLT